MKIIDIGQDLQAWRNSLPPVMKVGFVPTMGALHAGHFSLMERARRECDQVVVSVFVNPTQFNDPRDLTNYPRPLNQDLMQLESHLIDVAFMPDTEQIYSDGYRFEIHEKRDSTILCGPKRNGHFVGVLTVVMKLLNLVRPTTAYFGEKDFQQLRLIRDMVQAFFLPVEIVGCPTVREADGLAMSSRNLLLTPEQRQMASRLNEVLRTSNSDKDAELRLWDLGFQVDYVEDHWGRRLAAVFLGTVRLIDNVEL